jgi:hypothetical protein
MSGDIISEKSRILCHVRQHTNTMRTFDIGTSILDRIHREFFRNAAWTACPVFVDLAQHTGALPGFIAACSNQPCNACYRPALASSPADLAADFHQ